MKKILFLLVLLTLSNLNFALANPEKIDMAKWQYNSAENVFYQLGIKYCDNPVDEKYEKLAIFVPAQYMQCSQNDDETYSCKIDKKAKINAYTAQNAPIVIPVETPGYSANPALTDYKSVWEYTSEGFIYVYIGCRGKEHGAPAGVVDLKAGIRFIKYNKNLIPGDKIFTFGMSGGGAQSVIIGVSGNNKMYEPYLKQIGAVMNKGDDIYGSMSWCPITNLDTANEAYEWNMGMSRTNLEKNIQKLSSDMAKNYADYVNNTKFRREDGILLTLRETNHGIYQGGNYYKYLENVVNQSLTNFLADTLFPVDMDIYGKEEGFVSKIKFADENEEELEDVEVPHKIYNSAEEYVEALNKDKKWIDYENYKVQILSMEDFVKHMKPATKPVGAFDGLEKQQGENLLFGQNGTPSHFDENTAQLLENTKYSKEFSKDFEKVDNMGNTLKTRMNMYNPLYFILPSYKGYKTSKVAKFWRIRTGLSQTDTPLTTEVNLVLALKRFVGSKNVDFETIWGCAHVKAERRGTSSENFVKWVNKCLNN